MTQPIEYIRPSDSLDKLVKAGILPQWIAMDAELHGMSEAENILCEYDWDWNWDLGDGYTDEQLMILKDVRKRIELGISNYESNSELKAKDAAEKEARKIQQKKYVDYTKKFAGNYVDRYKIDWVLDFEKANGSLPLLHFLCFRTLLPTRTDIQKAQLMRLGISVDKPMSAEEVATIFPDIPLKKLNDLPYKKWALIHYYKELVEEILALYPENLPDETDSYWTSIIESQNLNIFNMTPAKLRRLLIFFRLNNSTLKIKKNLTKGIY